MEKIKSLKEINFSTPTMIIFNATVIDIVSEGDGEKRPIKFTLKFEDSGDQVVVTTWKFDMLETLKVLVKTDDVFEFKGQAGNYGNYGDQIRIGECRDIQLKSARKILKEVNIDTIKNEVTEIINTYIPKSSICRGLLDELLLNNEKFWVWPAATRIHHAYRGGLAKHSLNVCKNAISIWKTYQGSNLDIKTIVTASLLHDIGKLQEYREDGSRTKYGDLIPHPVAGYEKVVRYGLIHNIDPEKDMELLMVEHIILSHHEKLEYGAATQPGTLEAMVVAKADALDACFEACDKTLDNMLLNETSARLLAADGATVFKWH